MYPIFLAFLVIWGIFLGEFSAASALISKVVGKVQSTYVTSREVYISGWIEKVLFPEQNKLSKDPVKLPQANSAQFKGMVQSSLLEMVVALEAESFSAVKVSKAEIDQALVLLKRRLLDNSKMQTLGVKAEELRPQVRRKLIAKEFIRFKADSSVVSVTGAEAKNYFESNRLKFGDLPYESFKENIKVYLTREQVNKRLRDWFEVLQAKYKVTTLAVEGVESQ